MRFAFRYGCGQHKNTMWDSGSESGPRAPAGYITLLLSPDVRFNKCSSQSIDMFYLLTYLLTAGVGESETGKQAVCGGTAVHTASVSDRSRGGGGGAVSGRVSE